MAFKKIITEAHRWLGIFLSLIFVIWFLSSIVMIFEGFPHVRRAYQFSKAETFTINDSISQLPEKLAKGISELSIKKIANNTIYSIKYNNNQRGSYSGNDYHFYNANTLDSIICFPVEQLDLLIQNNYEVGYKKRVEINDYDQWIPWERYKSYFPIYKYYLDDDEHSVIYVSQKTCTVVQETTRYKRWCARFGAIPHWFYYKKLRLKVDLWVDVVVWLSFIGCFAAITGIIMGFLKQRKRKKSRKKKELFGFSPYKKKWYKWHHVTGYFFGIFVLTFVFSGMMSLYDVPQWIVPTEKTANYRQLFSRKKTDLSLYKLSVNKVIKDKRFKGIKKIEWKQIDGIPHYFVYNKKLNKPILIKADNTDNVVVNKLTKADFEAEFAKKCPDVSFESTLLRETDGYISRRGFKRGSIIKFVLSDANDTWLYFNTDNAGLTYKSDNNTRLLRWLYRGLHSFNFKVFENHDWLRKLILVILCIFGAIISVSGVVISYQHLTGRYKRHRRRKKQMTKK